MSRAAVCLVVLVLVPVAFSAQQQVQTTVARDGQVQTIITLPDGTQVPIQGGIAGGVQGPLVGGVQGGIVAGPQGQPTRDTRPTTGNSRIRGRVLVADTGQPARRATVRLSAPELREGRTTTTDLDGRYEFANIPAGRYSINASKNGFLSLSYGQARPNTPIQTLTLADKQTAESINVFLMRGGAIAGRVLDDFGDPVSGVGVMAMRAQFQMGRQRLVPVGQRATTNDIGEYRLFALAPGAYYVAATAQSLPTLVNGVSQSSEDRHGFAPVFYPGTTDAAAAARISMTSGQTVAEINLQLVGTRLANISGTAVDSQGRPITAGGVSAIPRGRVSGLPSYSGQLRQDGSFIVPNVPPGEYTVRAMPRMQPMFTSTAAAGQMTWSAATPAPPPSPGTAVVPAVPPGPVPPPEISVAFVSVNGDDLTGVLLTPVQKASVSGRIVFDDPAAAAGMRAATIRVTPQILNADDGLAVPMQGPPPSLRDDFSFELLVAPGLVMLRPNVMPSPGSQGLQWALKSVRVNGVDATNTGVEIRPGENLTGIEIEMTNRIPVLSGTVTTSGSQPAAGFSVVVFPQDRDLWTTLGPGVALFLRSDQNGRFVTSGLRAGRYYAAAVYELEPGGFMDPEYLQTIVSRATAFALGDGEKKTVDLRAQVQP